MERWAALVAQAVPVAWARRFRVPIARLAAAQAFGIAFTLSAELVALYSQVGNDLPTLNGNGQWVLPLPATYVIDRDGVIAYAHAQADYRLRAEPQDVLDQLRIASSQRVAN